MTKYEFINDLRDTLNGEVAAQTVEEYVSYYNNYFAEEMLQGKTEEEILNSLGSPRLIARSIIDANEQAGSQTSGYSYSYSEEVTYDEDNERVTERRPSTGDGKIIKKFVTILGVLAVVALVGTLLLNLIPIIAMVVVGLFIWSLITKDK